MQAKVTILIIEDEKNICDFIATTLKAQGYKAITTALGRDGISLTASQCPELILLDLGLPDIDGMEVIRQVRSYSSIPIIVISARTQEKEKVMALDLGADDYITKPFGVMELISRIRAVLRRSNVQAPSEETLVYQTIRLDPQRRTVTASDVPVTLTFKEFELLSYLLKNEGIVLTREKIMEKVWGFDYEGESRTVDMHIKSLRHKLGSSGELIQTVRGVGYKIGGQER